MKKINYLFVSLILLSSCVKHIERPFVINGQGPVLTEEVVGAEFHAVKSSIAANINIYESEDHYVNVIMEENLFEYLNASVIDGVLTINFGEQKVRSIKGIRIDIYSPSLHCFELSGAG
ncbi:MAG: GIN domain-containing protein, partial [bacterium]